MLNLSILRGAGCDVARRIRSHLVEVADLAPLRVNQEERKVGLFASNSGDEVAATMSSDKRGPAK